MKTAAIFNNNKNQAIRLPNEARFPDSVKRVTIRKVGNNLVISPLGESWNYFFTSDEFKWEGELVRGEQIESIRDEII